VRGASPFLLSMVDTLQRCDVLTRDLFIAENVSGGHVMLDGKRTAPTRP
jgi:hypothetical protein